MFCENPPHPLGERRRRVVGQRNVRLPRMLTAKAPRRLPMPDREHVHVRLLDQTLSASVEDRADAASCPHLQPAISGISSPYRPMYSLCSMSLPRISCLA